MKIENYKNPHASMQNPLVTSWDLMYIVRQIESHKRNARNLRKLPKRNAYAPVESEG